MNADSGIPPIVLVVGLQEPGDGAYRVALEEAGFWVAQAASPEDAVRDIVDLRPDVVIAALTAGRTLEAHPAMDAIPLIVLEDDEAVPPPKLRDGIERALAGTRESSRRPAAAGQAAWKPVARRRERVRDAHTCPVCASPLVWADRRTVGGIEYDYYRWCATGCGLYCFDRATDEWLKLA